MEIPSIQLSLEHIEELDFTCPVAKKSINIGKEIIPVKFVVNIYPDVKRDYFKLITGVRYIRRRNFIGQELLFYRIAVVYKIEKLRDFVKLENSQVIVDTRLLALLLSISIGSMRGMLALRTQNTVFKNYPLPLINVSEILTSMNITDSEGIGENLNIYYNN